MSRWKVTQSLLRICGKTECRFWRDPKDVQDPVSHSPGGCACEDLRPGCPIRHNDGLIVTAETRETK